LRWKRLGPILPAMAKPDSSLDRDPLARARALLDPPKRPERMWPVVGAAGLLALSALVFATAMIAAPPLTTEHVALQRGAP
jgi:hypothetical protein